MVRECIGREQGARRLQGGGDAVDVDGRGRTAKDVPPFSRRALFALQRELVGAEGRPSRVPRLVGTREAVPFGRCLGKPPRGKERARSDL